MIIYKKDGTTRATIHETNDSEEVREISGEEYCSVKYISSVYTEFLVGDYIDFNGRRYTLYKKPPTIDKKSTINFSYTLKFESPRADLAYVNFQLFDNTTIDTIDEFILGVHYAEFKKVYYSEEYWACSTATDGTQVPETGSSYWIPASITAAYNPATSYVYGAKVLFNNSVWKFINLTSSSGHSPSEGVYWTQVKTAPQWDFSATLTPQRFALMIADNMNRARPNINWTVGSCVAENPRQVTFSNAKCLGALSQVADVFETESWIGSDYTINIGKLSVGTSIPMAYGEGNGLKNIVRSEVSNTQKVTRLIALGSARNIQGTYRNGSPRLMLPTTYYIDSVNLDPSAPLEDVKIFEDIYPSLTHGTATYSPSKAYVVGDQVFYNGYSYDCKLASTGHAPTNTTYWKYSVGMITGIGNGVSTFVDAGLNLAGWSPFDDGIRMSDGTEPKVRFITGNLAGYEIPLKSYNSATGICTLGTVEDGTDNIVPSSNYSFALKDQYIFVDIYMPEAYITNAENRLASAATDYLSLYSVDQLSYKGTVDQIWATNNNVEFELGNLVSFTDANFGISALEYRIVRITKNITEPMKYDIELSTLPFIASKWASVENKIEKVDTYFKRNGSDSSMARSRTFRGAKESLDMAFDPQGDYFTSIIKPLIVETSQVLVGTNSQQYALTGLEFTSFGNEPNTLLWTAGTLKHNTIGSGATWNIMGSVTTPYNAGTAYSVGSQVYYDGYSYYCILASTGNLPTNTTYWVVTGFFTVPSADITAGTDEYYVYFKCTKSSTVGTVLFSQSKLLATDDATYYYFLFATYGKLINGVRQLWTSKGFTFISGDTITAGRIKSPIFGAETNPRVDINLNDGTMRVGSDTMYFSYNGTIFELVGSDFVSNGGNKIRISTDALGGRMTLLTRSTNPVWADKVIGTISFEEDGSGYPTPYIALNEEYSTYKRLMYLSNAMMYFNKDTNPSPTTTSIQQMKVSADGIYFTESNGVTTVFEVTNGTVKVKVPYTDTGGTMSGEIKVDSNGFLKLI